MARISYKVCDRCGKGYTEGARVRSYRWMRVQDDEDYKHSYLIRSDLCMRCHTDVITKLMEVLGIKKENAAQ